MLVCGLAAPAHAADSTVACPAVQPPVGLPPFSPTPLKRGVDSPIQVQSDRASLIDQEIATFSGNVKLRRGDLSAEGDELQYNRAKNSLVVTGNARLRNTSGDLFNAPQLHYWLDTETGVAENSGFQLGRNNARGDAAHVDFLEGNKIELRSARYTTCPQGQDDWYLKADRIELDNTTGTGRAHDMTVEFMDVPVFYFPYFSFPLTDARQSGFLIPRFGHGNRLGFVASVPYYFNLAPNYDATLTPRYMSRRGLQLLSEFRLKTLGGEGLAQAEYLPNDDQTGDYRASGLVNFQQAFSPYWYSGLDLQWASDINYFVDLGDTTNIASRTHLPRIAQLHYAGADWRFSARASGYQTLDATIPVNDRPYRQLPQLQLASDFPGGPGGIHYHFQSEWVNFQRSDSITGSRFELQPAVSLPLRNSFGFFVPKVGLHYTAYDLSEGTDTRPTRSLTVASLDSGLIFERSMRWNGTPFIQTLEPRLYYLRIPYKNQDSLPVFDTALPDFNFYNLFRENRFIGGDRVGDANQATLAITTRLLEEAAGVERVRLSLGEVFYFSDRRVSLPAGTVADSRSNTVAEIQALISPSWYARAGVEWDSAEHANSRGSAYLHYRPAKDRIINLGYRYDGGQDKQVDISGHWPITRGWTGLARWNYSLTDSRVLQAYAGFEYSACCWAVRAGAQRRILPDGNTDNAILFEIELSGLAKLGKAAENPLERGKFIFD